MHFFKDKQVFFCYDASKMKKTFFFLLAFILWGKPAFAEEMSPVAQQTPFGEIQLISCTTDLRMNGPLYLGVRALTKQGWKLDSPQLEITTSEPIPTAFFTPFKQPYSQEPVYPISAVLTQKPTQPITFNANGTWRACKGEECVTESIHLYRTLGTDIALFTPECSAITLALSNTPIPMYSNLVNAYARHNDKNQVEITLDFQQVPRTVTIYDINKQPLTLDIYTDKKRVNFTLPDSFNESQNPLRFFVRTYYHYYEVEPTLIPQNDPVPDVPLSSLQILQACFLFFLLSAVPVYWARVPLDTRKKFHNTTKQTLIFMSSLGVLMLVLATLYEYQTHNLLHLLNMPITKTYALILMSLGIIFIPASPLSIFLFLFITPHPYLTDLQGNYNLLIKLSPLYSFVCLTLLSFGIQFAFEKSIFKYLTGPNASKTWWVARLPWLALIIYTVFYL